MKVGVRIMYKAIIIDDEPWTIIDIEKTFSLEDMGFEIVGSIGHRKKHFLPLSLRSLTWLLQISECLE